jgi:hypothetical protein
LSSWASPPKFRRRPDGRCSAYRPLDPADHNHFADSGDIPYWVEKSDRVDLDGKVTWCRFASIHDWIEVGGH